MDQGELAKIVEEGVKELGLEWPLSDSIYEIKIPRKVHYPNEPESRQVTNPKEYLDFLYFNVFPLVDQLEKDAGIKYWHIMNHENLDLRLSIENEKQMKEVEKIVAQHGITEIPVTRSGGYDDPGLGSRLGCQTLLLLCSAQSKFIRDIVRSIYWLQAKQEKSAGEEINTLISNMIYAAPIYSSHMLLNVFPGNAYYEVVAYLNEGGYRLRLLLEQGGLPEETEKILTTVQSASQSLKKLLGFQ